MSGHPGHHRLFFANTSPPGTSTYSPFPPPSISNSQAKLRPVSICTLVSHRVLAKAPRNPLTQILLVLKRNCFCCLTSVRCLKEPLARVREAGCLIRSFGGREHGLRAQRAVRCLSVDSQFRVLTKVELFGNPGELFYSISECITAFVQTKLEIQFLRNMLEVPTHSKKGCLIKRKASTIFFKTLKNR